MEEQASIYVDITRVGRGLFARRAYRQGDEIGQVTGDLIMDAEYGSEYCIDLCDGRGLEPHPPFRYVNHSCQPNCELVVWTDGDDHAENAAPEVSLLACRDIRPGDELTIDYGWPADATIPCRCGSRRCRGWIVAEDELPYLNQKP